MKNKLIIFGTMLTAALLAVSAKATVFLSENFTYTNGNLTAVSGGTWAAVSGGGTLPLQVNSAIATFTNVPSGGSGEDDKRDIPGQPYTSGVLYMTAMVALSNAPTAANGDYFLALYSTNSTGGGYAVRIFASGTTTGGWSFGMTNSGTVPTDWTSDLTTNTWYKIVVRYDVGAKTTTFGVFAANHIPTDDSELTVSSPASTVVNITSVAIRQGSVSGAAWKGAIDYILVGDSLADVAGANVVPPAIAAQPQDNVGFVHGTATFSTVAVGDAGNAPLTYKWYFNTNTPLTESTSIIGTTSNVLTLTNLSLDQSGTYSAVVTDAGGTNVTRFAVLAVSPAPVPPTIDTDITPTSVTKSLGDNATFTVAAHGLPIPAYQWNFVPDTNTLVTNVVTGGSIVSDLNGSTLTLPLTSTNQSGKYFVTITNNSGYKTTNSSLATLHVTGSISLSVGQLRSMVDAGFLPTDTNSFFTIQGTVTTWTNMTSTTTSVLFYMQDDTGGIPVFWSGADSSTNTPPAGAVVKATGRVTSFNGLLELSSTFTNTLTPVTILATNTIPAPQPLPFDPNVTGNTALMKTMEGSYMVASNVFLASGATFVSGANDTITNILDQQVETNTMVNLTYTNLAGQTFVLFVNAATDLKTQAKPPGPLTIFGVLGFFTTAGFEFTPSRYADVVSYVHITNFVSNVKHFGDLLTNQYTENVLRTGETLTTLVSIGDAAGGTVTLTPDTGSLPASASWSGVTGGTVGTATFSFTPTPADAGSNYVINVGVTSTAGTSYTYKFTVYVPTATEQQVAVTEFLANPTTNTALPNFNPLNRPTDTIAITTNDIYLEVANVSGSSVDFSDWLLTQGATTIMDFDALSSGPPSVPPTSAFVVYGGNTTELPNLATPAYKTTGTGFILPNTGGTIVLRNGKGNIVDRVVYTASNLSTNGSLTRFPTIDSPFVLQTLVSSHHTTAGLQYDGSPWSVASQIPAGVSNIVSAASGNTVTFTAPASSSQMNTLWSAPTLQNHFNPVAGQTVATPNVTFTVTNAAPIGFYYITTQTNF